VTARPTRRRLAIAAAAVLVSWGLVASCGDGAGAGPMPAEDLLLRVVCDADAVDLGRPFPVTVVRAWRDDVDPDPWDDAALRPLVLRPVATARRTGGGKVEETRTFDAFALTPDAVTVAPPEFSATARSGGERRTVRAEGFALRVRRALDPAAPGVPELPGGLLAEPFPWRATGIAAALAIAAAVATAVVVRRRRARNAAAAARFAPSSVAEPPPRPAPHERALERLAALRGRSPATREENDAWHVEASAVVRDYVGERFDLRAAEATTDETLAAVARRLGARGDLALLAETLRAADLVKFARDEPSAADRERTLDAAARFVRESAAP
jgi:hypothetical protein